jgi:mannose-6-phosphate isomerase
MGLAVLYQELGTALVGQRHDLSRPFPLLIKLLDAADRLSLQVHPSDEYARIHEPGELGKSEMWLALQAEPDATIVLGVRPELTAATFRAAAEAGDLAPYLHTIRLREGDFVCVPSGSLHAILGGLLIVEIQQSSNITYRVFDWGRVGADGQPRALHLEQAIAVINFDQVTPALPQPEPLPSPAGTARWLLCANDHFVVEKWQLEPGAVVAGRCGGDSLEIWGCLSGQVVISAGSVEVVLDAVRFTLLPAGAGNYSISAAAGVSLVRAYLP